MSDVILYAALKENVKLQQELLEFCTGGGGGGISFYQSPQGTGYPYVGDTAGGSDPTCPAIVQDWLTHLSPEVQVNQTNGFKVCGSCWRCGAGCTWCVPAGVSRVQFQIWGPGGGTSNNCCCGGAPFGPSGAYMVITQDVSQGECYCLCGGCAYCCCGEQTTPGICGTPSWVRSSNGNLCICADSGISCYCHWNADIESGTCGCAIPDPNGNCGAHGCSGWNFCWDSGNDDLTVCHAFSRATWHVNCTSESRNPVSYGINGLYPFMKIGSDLQTGTCSVSTPVFGFENCVCTEIWNGSTCHGHCRHASRGFLQIPGAGGYASRVFGGCRACGGDHGRMGMVCVSWECN